MAAPATQGLAEPVAPVAEPTPPPRNLSPRDWVWANLFPTRANAVLTVVVGAAAAWIAYRLARWVFVTADWAVVRVNLRLFMVWLFPTDELWRLWVSTYLLAVVVGLAVGLAVASSARRAVSAAGGDLPGGDLPGGGLPGGGLPGGVEPGIDVPAVDVSRGDTVAPAPRGHMWAGAGSAVRRFWPALLGVGVVLSFTRTVLAALLTVGLVAALAAAQAGGRRVPASAGRWAWTAVVLGVVAALQVVTFGADGVGWDDWGGLHLTVAATVAGIALAFPLGLVLALARRSSLPGIRVVSVGYIEGFRAVPLVTLLFMGQYMIGFLFPTQVDPPSFLVRAVIAITLFEAAYVAEIVRGGLQAVPRGQIEAAQAIGLSPTKVMRLIVLPQALRAVIPAMVGQFISLFKDTSLLSIVGFVEILAVAQNVPQQDLFRGQGAQIMTFAFVGFVYWAGCSTMARESRRLERRLGVGER